LLNAWIDDLTPPAVRVLTTRVTAGRPLIVAQAVDGGSGVDPLSLVLSYNNALVGASAYDPFTGLVVFGIPNAAPAFKPGRTRAIVRASDYQEAKNINTVGNDIYPNTQFLATRLRVVNGPTVSWITPPPHVCALKTERLLVVADSTKKVSQVAFTHNGKTIGVAKTGNGVYSVTWKTAGLEKGTQKLVATVTDASGRKAAAVRVLRICK
jgi:hypothetical protein